MKRLFIFFVVGLWIVLPAFSQSNDYYLKQAESYQREAKYYFNQAEGYEREAKYYNNQAQKYLKDACPCFGHFEEFFLFLADTSQHLACHSIYHRCGHCIDLFMDGLGVFDIVFISHRFIGFCQAWAFHL